MNPGLLQRKSLCHGCRGLREARLMIHAVGSQRFCSKACAAKVVATIPLPRRAS